MIYHIIINIRTHITNLNSLLSNQYGKRKPLILLPLLGAFITNMAYVLISLFGEALPLEIFFLTKAWDFCGGMPLYYLGVCSYAASNSKKTNRFEKINKENSVIKKGGLKFHVIT